MMATVKRVIFSCLKAILALGIFVFCSVIVMYLFSLLNIDRHTYAGVACTCTNILTLGALWLFWQIDRQKEEYIFFNKTRPVKVICTLFVALGLTGFVVVYMLAANYISEYLESLKENLDHYRETINRYTEVPQQEVPLWDSLLYIFATCTLVPLCEEFMFRGVFMGKMRMIMPAGFAVLVQAVVFGLMHGITIHIGYALVCGIVMGAVYLYCGNLWMSVLIHAVFNLLGSALPNLLALEQFGIARDIRTEISYVQTLCEYFLMFPAAVAFVYLWYSYRKSKEQKTEEQTSDGLSVSEQEASTC